MRAQALCAKESPCSGIRTMRGCSRKKEGRHGICDLYRELRRLRRGVQLQPAQGPLAPSRGCAPADLSGLHQRGQRGAQGQRSPGADGAARRVRGNRGERTVTTYKVLPFEGAAGHVGGHEIKSYNPAIEYVMFERWDEVAKMSLEVRVHWTRWTQYTKRTWPAGGTVTAVLIKNGERRRAEGRYAMHANREEDYLAAPIVCRDMIRITNSQGDPFLEVVGAMDYLLGRI